MIRHTVVFRLKHAAGSAEEKQFLAASRRVLSAIAGVEDFEAMRQVSTKNDFAFGFAMAFADPAAYDRYNAHPDHVAYVRDRWAPEV